MKRSKEEMLRFRLAIRDIVQADPPMTCRHVFYLAVAAGLVEKSEQGYGASNAALRWLRREKLLSYADIVDSTRQVSVRPTWASVGELLTGAAEQYARHFWHTHESTPVIFVEKDAVAGIIQPICDQWAVPLVSARGDASYSLLHELSEYVKTSTRQAVIYTFTDLDWKGEGSIVESLGALDEYYGCCNVALPQRAAVTREQVKQYKLPRRPEKHIGGRKWAVELDALPKAVLQQLVEDCIRNHVDDQAWQEHQEAEEADRATLVRIAKKHRK